MAMTKAVRRKGKARAKEKGKKGASLANKKAMASMELKQNPPGQSPPQKVGGVMMTGKRILGTMIHGKTPKMSPKIPPPGAHPHGRMIKIKENHGKVVVMVANPPNMLLMMIETSAKHINHQGRVRVMVE